MFGEDVVLTDVFDEETEDIQNETDLNLQEPNQEEMKTCLTNTLPGILLDLEMQYPSTVSLSRLQDYLSNQLYYTAYRKSIKGG